MSAREFGWVGLVLALMIGLSLFALGGNAVAQHTHTYWGDDACGMCHPDEYSSYMKHGHAWQLVQTAGANPPPADLYPWGVPLPQLPAGATWDLVEYILGNFKSGEGSVVFNTGYRNLAGTSSYSCGKCHTTGFQATGHQRNHLGVEMAGAVGTWDLDGIQCEVCHGPKKTMSIAPVKGCGECHTAGDAQLRLQFATSEPWVFTGHHAQGDEFAKSPHKDYGCILCHDPHRSVWHEDGGVLYSQPAGEGNMCTQCHNKRVFGVMGDIGLECVDCHMPLASAGGTGATHLFRINPTALAAADNTYQADGKTWWNTDQNGDASLTLDLACGTCHGSMSVEEMARFAPLIHRPPGLVDITVNGGDKVAIVRRTDVVSVDFSVFADLKPKGMKADWWVMCQGPYGWSSWNGSRWVAGKRAWLKNSPLVDVPTRNVLKSRLKTPGNYTYWVVINAADGSQNVDSVSVVVIP